MNCIRSEVLWFSDGNVVLEAEGDIYRVFQGILALQSPIFADMFSVPQGSSAELEVFEGAPLIHVHDRSLDLRQFLKALHTPNFYEHNVSGVVDAPLDVTISILRLSEKYDVGHLRSKAIEHLTSLCPSDLDSWGSALEQTHVHPFVLANLVRECGILRYLPSALLRCYTLPLATISDGVRVPGSDEVIILSPLNKEACMKARSILLVTHITQINLWMTLGVDLPDTYPGSGKCNTPAVCDKARRLALAKVFTKVEADTIIPFCAFNDLNLTGVCAACRIFGKEKYSDAQTKLWQKLPELFGLPPWGETNLSS